MTNDYPSQEVREWLPKCASCGSDYVNVNWERLTIKYGVAMVTELEAVIPIETCAKCGFSYTAWRAEEIRDATVKHYLDTGKKALDIPG